MNRKHSPVDGVGTPEAAAWLIYAELVQALRWRRHVAAAAPTPSTAAPRAAPPRVGVARARG